MPLSFDVLTFIPEFSMQLRSAEEKREEAEARARELEKQASFIILVFCFFICNLLFSMLTLI